MRFLPESADPIHDTESDDCWCKPQLILEGDTEIYVHNDPSEN